MTNAPFFVDEITLGSEMTSGQDNVIGSSEKVAKAALVENFLLVVQLVQALGGGLQVEADAFFEVGLPLWFVLSRRERPSGDLVEREVRVLGHFRVADADHGLERRIVGPTDVNQLTWKS